jgi:hypothetical protein
MFRTQKTSVYQHVRSSNFSLPTRSEFKLQFAKNAREARRFSNSITKNLNQNQNAVNQSMNFLEKLAVEILRYLTACETRRSSN